MSTGDNSQISAVINSTAAASAFQTPQYPLAAERAQAPALGRLLAIEERIKSKPPHILELDIPRRPLDRQPQVSKKPANALPTEPARQRWLCIFRDRIHAMRPLRRTTTIPINRVPAPQDGRNHPPALRLENASCSSAGDKLAHSRLGPLRLSLVLGDDGANAKPVLGSALVIHAGVSLAP